MVAKKLGFDRTINRNLAAFGSPSWTQLIAAQGIKLSRSPSGVNDGSDRATNNYSTLLARYKIAVDAEANWNKGAGLTALRTAFLGKSVIDLAVLDNQPGIATGVGYRGEWAVTKFNFDFPLVGAQKVSFNLQPHGNHTASQQVATYTDATVSPGTAEAQSDKRTGHVASVNDASHAPITAVRDWKLNLEWTTFDAGDKLDTMDKVLMTKLKVSAEIQLIWDRSVAQLTTIETAFQAHSKLQMWFLDGAYATTGSWGITGDFAVTDFPSDDQLETGQMISIKFEPHANATNALTFVTL